MVFTFRPGYYGALGNSIEPSVGISEAFLVLGLDLDNRLSIDIRSSLALVFSGCLTHLFMIAYSS